MTARSSTLRIRIDAETEAQAEAVLDALGLSIADAVRMLLRRVVAEQGLPPELKIPNKATRAAMAEADEIADARSARFDALIADIAKAR